MTEPDEQLAAQVRARGFTFTARDARYLRARDVFELPPVSRRKGGKGRQTVYPPEAVDVACAIETAKSHPNYRRRFGRAVLIAWADGAPVGTVALRRAFKEEFIRDASRAGRASRSRAHGGTGSTMPATRRKERQQVMTTLCEAWLGMNVAPTSTSLAQLARPLAAELVGTLGALPAAAGQAPGDLANTLAVLDHATGVVSALATRYADTSADLVRSGWEADRLMPVVRSVLHRMSGGSVLLVTASAPRSALDDSRDVVGSLVPDVSALDRAWVAARWLSVHAGD